MKRKLCYILSMLCFFQFLEIKAQAKITDCDFNIDKAIDYLRNENYSQQDSLAAIDLIKPCVKNENPYAQLLMGRLYLNNAIISDNVKGFKLIRKAAKQKHALACSDLGDLFKYGLGCEINYKKAKKWYKKAHKLGDARGTYSVGYMHYKGLNVAQNYSKAIRWFKKSDYPMAKHWLGVCYYFGYGVKVNKQKAMRLLSQNSIKNSAIMLDCMEYHLKEEQTVKNDLDYMKILDGEPIDFEFFPETLNGKWNGSLVKLDWAEKQIEQIEPIALELNYDDEKESTTYSWVLNGKESKGVAFNDSNMLFFENLNLNLKRLYFSGEGEQDIPYSILSSDFSLRAHDDKTFLTAILDSYVIEKREPGNKFALILTKAKVTTENGKEITDETIEGLSNQDDSFIKLYPNPFEKDLYISYALENPGLVNIEVSDLHGSQSHILEQAKQQTAGDYIYYFDGAKLKKGINIITVFVNGEKYTKLIAKK
ncbi:T9SS type A sorting domain-containing protein [Algibacter sp. 2305UL17-15]|uniref:T9SS type A sorting domain-containing protein n=1 Tax=Algibacter sp. 2305UL17-15 TaxID=3231268 RepID=UPI0034583036